MRYIWIVIVWMLPFAILADDYKKLHKLHAHKSPVTFVTFRGEDALLASGDKTGKIFLWNSETGSKLGQLTGHEGQITHISFNPTGNLVISASYDGTIKIWSLSTYETVATINSPSIGAYGNVKGNEPTFVTFSKDGQYVYFGGYNAQVLRYSLHTGETTKIYQDKKGGITAGIISHDGRYLYVSATAFVYQLNLPNGELVQTFSKGTGQKDYICELELSHTTDELMAWTYGGNVLIWKDGALKLDVKMSPREGTSQVISSLNDKLLLTGNLGVAVKLWKRSLDSDLPKLQQTLQGHRKATKTFAFTKDAKYIATGSDDKTVIIWRKNIDLISDTESVNEVIEDGERPVHLKNNVGVRNNKVTIYVWDHQEYDGDTITLFLNGKKILNYVEVKYYKRKVEVELDPNGDNLLILHAHNLGRIPPNTVAITIDDGFRPKTLQLRSNLNVSEAIRLKVQDN